MIKLLLIIIFILLILLYLTINKKQELFEQVQTNETKKIAFLFLIKDKMNKEELWHRFFNNIDKNKYSIYIHYKNDNKLKYFDEYKLKTTVETKWGDISLVHAQKLLLNEALKDESNYKFIYVSDSCIPVKSFDYIYNFLTANNNSYFNVEVKIPFLYNKIMYSFKKFKEMLKQKESFLNNYSYNKTFQWFILNREHANIINNDKTEIINYNKTFAPDEIYFLTILRNKYVSNIIINDNPYNYTTFANWNLELFNLIKIGEFSNDYKKFNSIVKPYKYPYEYIKIDDKELDYIVKSKILFMRKILPETELNESILPYTI